MLISDGRRGPDSYRISEHFQEINEKGNSLFKANSIFSVRSGIVFEMQCVHWNFFIKHAILGVSKAKWIYAKELRENISN
jgi:hypothetical protein